jgi:hypothetical protein
MTNTLAYYDRASLTAKGNCIRALLISNALAYHVRV